MIYTMDYTNLIPKSKGDIESVKDLHKLEILDIQIIVPELLIWLQDYNWPVAKYIAEYLSHYSNQITDDLIKILRSNDEVWKYWIMTTLILNSKFKPNNLLINEVNRIYKDPTNSEITEEIDQLALEILEKYREE